MEELYKILPKIALAYSIRSFTNYIYPEKTETELNGFKRCFYNLMFEHLVSEDNTHVASNRQCFSELS